MVDGLTLVRLQADLSPSVWWYGAERRGNPFELRQCDIWREVDDHERPLFKH